MSRNDLKNWFRQIFFYPRETLEEQVLDYDEYWNKKRSGGVSRLSDWQKERADIIVAQLLKEGVRDVTIADIGCGDAAPLMSIVSRIPGARAVAYDSSDVALTLAAQAGASKVVKFDLNKDTELVEVEKADYILFLEVLEHVPDSEKVLAAARRKADRGVFFSFPNSGFFTFRLRLLFGKFPAQWLHMPNEHLRFWTLTDLRWWLRAQHILNAKIFTYKGVPVLNKLLPNLFAAGTVTYIPR